MRKHFFLSWSIFFSFSLLTFSVNAQLADAVPYSEKIDTAQLRNHIEKLASAEMKGRKSGTSESLMAADYIKSAFAANQLVPLGGISYLSCFIITRDTLIPQSIILGKQKLQFGSDFYTTFPQSENNSFSKNLVLLRNDISKWNASDIKNNAVLLLPGLYDTSSQLKAELSLACAKARMLGAKAILIPSIQFSELPIGTGINNLNRLFSTNPALFESVPVVYVSWQAVATILGKTNLDLLLKSNFDINTSAYDGHRVKFQMHYRNSSVKANDYNVAGYIPGKDTNQFLIIGAHYDHIGKNGSTVYFGADDNASGTSALLEMSRIFSIAYKNGYQPERSVIFVAFGAEESGLLGSFAFTYNGLYNNDSTTAMLNMDMIGRRKSEGKDFSTYILGKDQITTDWRKILDKVNAVFSDLKDLGTPLKGFFTVIQADHDPDMLIYRSDQFHFLKQNVPALFFTDYMTKDYHLPSDTPDKIDFEVLKKRTQFIFLNAWELAFRKSMLSRTSTFKK